MQRKKYTSPLMIILGIILAVSFTGCSGGGGGGGSAPRSGSAVSPSDLATQSANLANALSTENVIDIHDKTSSNYNSDCVSCHGDKTDGRALDGRPDAHAAMIPWTPGDTTNEKCVWCHTTINLEYSNPTHNTYVGAYSDYEDPNIPSAANQLSSARMDTNHYNDGEIRRRGDVMLCVQCHGYGSSIEFYAK